MQLEALLSTQHDYHSRQVLKLTTVCLWWGMQLYLRWPWRSPTASPSLRTASPSLRTASPSLPTASPSLRTASPSLRTASPSNFTAYRLRYAWDEITYITARASSKTVSIYDSIWSTSVRYACDICSSSAAICTHSTMLWPIKRRSWSIQ